MSIADKITALGNAKTAIVAAIRAKGGVVNSGDGFSDFATDIATIPSGGTDTRFDELLDGSLSGDIVSNVTTVKDKAFYSCSALVSISLPNATSISAYAFSECDNLSTVNIPNITSVPLMAFFTRFGLVGKIRQFDFIRILSIEQEAFNRQDIRAVVAPVLNFIGLYAFQTNTNLAVVDLSQRATISAYAFSGCSSLASIILRNEEISTLSSVTALNGTPIASGAGYIYVPDNLIDSYRAATNWSTYALQIRGISQLEVTP